MSKIQSIAFFTADGWTPAKAKIYMKSAGFRPIKPVDKHLHGQLRYRLADPRKFRRFRVKTTKYGFNLIIGFK
jgi:hypothetical protein